MRFAGKFGVLLGLVLACFSLGQSAAGAAELEMTAAELLQSCDAGDSAACDELGTRLHDGAGVRKNDKASTAMYQRACDGGNAIGCFNLGRRYAVGLGVKKDKQRAASLYARSCDGGNSWGCINLGNMVFVGDGVAVDKRRAAELYSRACDADDAKGCANLAYMYDTGDGIAADPAMANSLFAKACSGGLQSACNRSPTVAAAAPAPQCRTVRGTSDVGEVDRLFCLENDGQWRSREARLVTPIPPPVDAPASSQSNPAPSAAESTNLSESFKLSADCFVGFTSLTAASIKHGFGIATAILNKEQKTEKFSDSNEVAKELIRLNDLSENNFHKQESINYDIQFKNSRNIQDLIDHPENTPMSVHIDKMLDTVMEAEKAGLSAIIPILYILTRECPIE